MDSRIYPKSDVAKSNSGFNAIYNIMAYLYVGCFVIIGMIFGFSPIIYGLFAIIAMIFILPSHLLGINIIILMTMLFERWFTLQPVITEYAVYKIYPLDIILMFSLIGWFLTQAFRNKSKIVFGWAEKILLIFIILNGIYLLRSFYDINADVAVAFSTFKNYAIYPLLYFLVLYSVQTKEQFKNVIHLILLGGVLIIGFLVFGIYNGNGLWTEYTPLSTAGVRLLAGTHAYYLVLATLIATSLIAFDRFRSRGLTSLIIVIWLFGIMASLMRHLWVSLFAGVIILLLLIPNESKKSLFKSSKKAGLIVISLILLITLSVNLFPLNGFSQSFNDTYSTINDRVVSIMSGSQDTSINWRINFWHAAKEPWLESPLFGLGYGKTLPLELGDWQTFEEIRNIHNSPLAITIQMGLVGIALFAMFIVSSVYGSLKNIFKSEELKPYYFGLVSGVVAILVASLFQPYLETNLTGIFLWILLGLLRTSVVINKQEA